MTAATTRRIMVSDRDQEHDAMTTRYAQRNHVARSLADVRVGEAMHLGLITCDPAARLTVVARVMAAHRIHCVGVPAAGDPGSWGIVSDLDVIDAVFAGETSDRTAGETATGRTLTISAADTMERAAELMYEHRACHVLVVDSSSNALGVVSSLDVADVLAELTSEEN